MKELITEQQADMIVAILAGLATWASLVWGAVQSRKLAPGALRVHWMTAVLFAFTGPVIWCFWGVYNSIENHYGLDSVKALEINFGIVMAISLVFVVLHSLIRRWTPVTSVRRRR